MPLPTVNCSSCGIKKLCLPVNLAESEINHLDHIVQRQKPLPKGKSLFQPGDEFNAIFAVRSGTLKSYCISENGEQQIISFHLPGEIIGLDALNKKKYSSIAEAVELSSICTIPFNQLELLSSQIPHLQHQLLSVMSREIDHDHELIHLLSKKNADERIAAFLVNLSSRFASRGLAKDCFSLVMSRGDIANYLGLAAETTSRLFTRLKREKLIAIEGKQITLLDMPAIYELAGSNCPH